MFTNILLFYFAFCARITFGQEIISITRYEYLSATINNPEEAYAISQLNEISQLSEYAYPGISKMRADLTIYKYTNPNFYCPIVKRQFGDSSIIFFDFLRKTNFSQEFDENNDTEGKLILVKENSLGCNCQIGEVQHMKSYDTQAKDKGCSLLLKFDVLPQNVTKRLSEADNDETLPKLVRNPKVISNITDPNSLAQNEKRLIKIIKIDREYEPDQNSQTDAVNFQNLLKHFDLVRKDETDNFSISLNEKQLDTNLTTVLQISGEGTISLFGIIDKAELEPEESVEPTVTEPNESKANLGAIIGGTVGGAVLFAVIIVIAVVCYRKNRTVSRTSVPNNVYFVDHA